MTKRVELNCAEQENIPSAGEMKQMKEKELEKMVVRLDALTKEFEYAMKEVGRIKKTVSDLEGVVGTIDGKAKKPVVDSYTMEKLYGYLNNCRECFESWKSRYRFEVLPYLHEKRIGETKEATLIETTEE